jgi:hypothetical protein
MIKSIIFFKKNAINKRMNIEFKKYECLFLFWYDKCSEI